MDYSKSIKELLFQYIKINDDEWNHFSSMIRFKKFRKNEIILSEGSLTTNVYFVLNGVLRTYFTDTEGNEKTFHFSTENNFATDYEGFLKGTTSQYSIQALEDTYVALMSLDMLKDAYQTLRYGEKLGRILAEDHFFLWSDRIKDIYMLTPLERYNNMRRQFPNILQRVPQHYIASYLNITPVHLSRLKKTGL